MAWADVRSLRYQPQRATFYVAMSLIAMAGFWSSRNKPIVRDSGRTGMCAVPSVCNARQWWLEHKYKISPAAAASRPRPSTPARTLIMKSNVGKSNVTDVRLAAAAPSQVALCTLEWTGGPTGSITSSEGTALNISAVERLAENTM
jgi:hypothetical protein